MSFCHIYLGIPSPSHFPDVMVMTVVVYGAWSRDMVTAASPPSVVPEVVAVVTAGITAIHCDGDGVVIVSKCIDEVVRTYLGCSTLLTYFSFRCRQRGT